jgi:hypothetical protein
MELQNYVKQHLFSYIKQSYRMLIVILIIDLIPLFGVLYWGWGTMDSIYLYFFETLIICIVTHLKMRRSKNIIAFSRWQKRLGIQANQYAGKVGEMATKATKKRFSWLRILISFSFLVLNIPLSILLMMLMLGIEGKGFSLSAIFGYNGGHTNLFVMSVNTFYIMIVLLTAQHFYAYYKKYVQGDEQENAGMLNEALAFELRIIIQSIVMIGGVALIYFFDFSKVMVIILIIIKTLIDLFAYLRNRYWKNVVKWMEDGMDEIGIEKI